MKIIESRWANMNTQHIGSFADSVITTLTMFLGEQCACEQQEPVIVKQIPQDKDMHIFIGITGDLYGTAVLSMNLADSLKLASAVIGMDLSEHNELSLSAIKEVLNISAGGAVSKLAVQNKHIDITPPALVSGDNVNIQMVFPLVSTDFSIKDIKFTLSLSTQEKAPRKVMVVEDSGTIRAILKDMLERNGFEVIGLAVDGVDALQQLKELNPEILLLDIEMPRMNGIEVLQYVKANRPGIKTVMLTGLGDPSIVQQAARLGADGYVLKPVNNSLLMILKNL